MMALISTPAGSSAAGSSTGLFVIGVVKREFGCAAGSSLLGVQRLPRQSMHSRGGSLVLPSHQTSPSGSIATFVKIVSFWIIAAAFGFDFSLVPGTTPK